MQEKFLHFYDNISLPVYYIKINWEQVILSEVKMKNYILLLMAVLNLSFLTGIGLYAQNTENSKQVPSPQPQNEINKILYAGSPNHRKIVIKAFELAVNKGFVDTGGITHQQILDRLEAGAYSEDLEPIPGIVGEHFPAPWNQGPEFDFYGYYPISKVPYGNYLDTLSGWSRGLYHGFDPVHGYHWPGTNLTTIEWAEYEGNNFSWENAVYLYNTGHKEKAYECLGHVLHLLADLSVPAHVNVVNHGISISSDHAGTFYDPDILNLVVDEYEMALSGGISIPAIYDFIPDILNEFRNSLNLADADSIPELDTPEEYFNNLAVLTYNNSIVRQYYSPPDSEGEWGNYTDGNGNIVIPSQYFITPPAQIGNRWAQISLRCTASELGPLFPKQQMEDLCAELIPGAVEYSAGLLLYFRNIVTDLKENHLTPSVISLSQNFPNPFNPSTIIRYSIDSPTFVNLTVYDLLGKEVAVLINKEQIAGDYELEFFPDNLAGGIYFYRLEAGNYQSVKKMIYLK